MDTDLKKRKDVKSLQIIWFLLVIFVLLIIYSFLMASTCENTTACKLQVMGHIYPGFFIMSLAYSWKYPELRQKECAGMITFWLMYWTIDLIQHKGVDTHNLKIMQHYSYTMLVGVCGIFRLMNSKADKFIMTILSIGFAFFVLMHPQPNDIGIKTHNMCAVWTLMFLIAFLFDAKHEGTMFLLLSAFTFMSSQLALTEHASKIMDPVAYFSFVTAWSLLVITLINKI